MGLFILGKDFSAKTLVGTTFVPLVIWLTQGIDLHVHDAMLGAIYGGIVLGVGLGIVYRGGGSTGGTAMIAQLLKKFTGLSSGFSQLLVDGFVVAASAVVFSLELALFALISIYVTSKVIDFVQLQTSPTKLVMIITEKEAEIQRIIRDEIDRGIDEGKVTWRLFEHGANDYFMRRRAIGSGLFKKGSSRSRANFFRYLSQCLRNIGQGIYKSEIERWKY